MTIDEAIKHCLEVAEGLEKKANTYGIKQAYIPKSREPVDCISCAADHRQLAEWLMELKDLRAEQNEQYVFIHELMTELKEAKRLLKAAAKITKNLPCDDDNCSECVHNDNGYVCSEYEYFEWRYADEALKLIGEKEGE